MTKVVKKTVKVTNTAKTAKSTRRVRLVPLTQVPLDVVSERWRA